MTAPIIGLTLNYRDAARTSRCVSSLIAAGAQGVMVWDNSEDGGESAAALRAQWSGEGRVIIEQSPRNLGFAAGVNQGISAILTRWPQSWVMLINNDATLQPTALGCLRLALQQQPQAVIAFPRVDHAGHVSGVVHYQRHFALLRFDRAWRFGSFASPPGSALLIAPERAELPLFDEDFFMYGEDVFLGWRLGTERMVHVPKVLVWHEGSASSRNGSAFYETRVVAGHWLLAYKLARSRLDLTALLTCRAISLGARAIWRSWRARSGVPLRALFQGWRLAQQQRRGR